jgi:uncharacterized protein (TIGR02598 family)
MKQARRSAGFSLVEVVLAVGVAAFVLVAITGLLSVSLNSARESATDTLIVSMASRALSDLRSQPFTNLNPSLGATSNRLYFDDLGVPTNTPPAMGFACDVVMQGDTNTYNPSTNLPAAERVSLLRVRLIFSTLGRPGTNRVIQSSIAQY